METPTYLNALRSPAAKSWPKATLLPRSPPMPTTTGHRGQRGSGSGIKLRGLGKWGRKGRRKAGGARARIGEGEGRRGTGRERRGGQEGGGGSHHYTRVQRTKR